MESCCVPPEKRIKTPTSCILVSFGGAFLLFENPSTHTKLEAKKDFNVTNVYKNRRMRNIFCPQENLTYLLEGVFGNP